MKYFNRILLFVAFVSYFALGLFFEPKTASAYDVALFSWLVFRAIAEELKEMK